MAVHWRGETHRGTPFPSDKGRGGPDDGTDQGAPKEPVSWRGAGSLGACVCTDDKSHFRARYKLS